MSTAKIRFHERPERGLTNESGTAKSPMMTTASGSARRQCSSASCSGLACENRSMVEVALVDGAVVERPGRALVAAPVQQHDEAVAVGRGLDEAALRHHHPQAVVLRRL